MEAVECECLSCSGQSVSSITALAWHLCQCTAAVKHMLIIPPEKNSASSSLLFRAQLMGGDANSDSDDFLTRLKPSRLHMYNWKKK